MVAKCLVAESRGTSKGGLEWPYWMTDMVVEMLTNRTPPNSISPNILSICRHISPNHDLVRELPGKSLLRECRSVLAVHTKTLGVSQIAGSTEMIEHKSDETSRRGVTFGNSIVRISSQCSRVQERRTSFGHRRQGFNHRRTSKRHRTHLCGRSRDPPPLA